MRLNRLSMGQRGQTSLANGCNLESISNAISQNIDG